jgi:hypothetical protein
MHVEPDATEAVEDRTQLLRRIRGVLERAELAPPGSDALRHPAAVEAAHFAQRALRSGPLSPQQRRVLTARLERLSPPAFGPTDPQQHLVRSVARALRTVPTHLGEDGQPAHTRCNAAALTDPFLLPEEPRESDSDASGRSGVLLVATPLRADPRPLTGLFQQTAVPARSVLLYRRLVHLDPDPVVGARHERLLGSARQAVDTLGAHAELLTAHGIRLLRECADVLGARE